MPPIDRDRYPNAGKDGYHHLGDHLGADVILQNNMKLNFHNYPFLRKVKMIPFWHANTLLMNEKDVKFDAEMGK